MYESFTIENFRGFQDVTLEALSRVNLITGRNNVGKSAVLEAVFIHSGAYNPDLVNVINGLRGIAALNVDVEREHDSPWDSIFYNYRATKAVKLRADIDGGGWEIRLSHVTDNTEIGGLKLSIRQTYERAVAQSTRIAAKILKLEFRRHKSQPRNYFLIIDKDGKRIDPSPPAPIFPSRLQYAGTRVNAKEEVARFARVQIDGTQDFIVQSLAILEPRLVNLAVVVEAGEAMIHGDIGLKSRRYIPLAMMGDGINRLCSVLLLIASAAKGVVMIDEIDLGWHYSVLGTVWGKIFDALKLYDVQIFCTTHSRECLSAAHQIAKERSDYPLSAYRLERQKKDGAIHVVRYDKETMDMALTSDLEVR